MQDVIVVELPPDKPNVYLACKTFTLLMETFCPIVEKLKVERVHMGRIIVFCKQRDLCNQIYSLFVLSSFTDPPNMSVLIRLVDKFMSGTHPEVITYCNCHCCFWHGNRLLILVLQRIYRVTSNIGHSERDMKPSCALLQVQV